MPLFHSIACSLQLAAHAQTHKNPQSRTEPTHARMNASVFSVTSCPDMSLKSGAELGMNPTFSCGIKQEAYSLFSFTLKLVTSVRQEEKKKGNKIHKCVHLSTYCNPNTHVPTGEDQTVMQMCTSQRE